MSSGGRDSGGKGLFSRNKLHKITGFSSSSSSIPKVGEPYQVEGPDAASRSSAKSARSHHSRLSVSSNKDNRDTIYGDELNPLYSTAGVVTSIPYDSVVPDLNRTPIPMDYGRPTSRGDAGHEITPHSIARMGDYHQYPTVLPQAPQQQYSHPTGPRPPPSSSGSSTLTANSYYAPSKEYSASTMSSSTRHTNGSQVHYPSNSTHSARSSDQMSVYSSLSSATRSSMISVAPTIAESMMPNPYGSATEFTMDRPQDDEVVEKMFYDLMIKRGYMNLPEQARRQLMAKPVSGKWLMIYQDKLADWQAEQKRRAAANVAGKDLDEDSPQWYVKKIMEGNISAKQLGSLSVSLRTQPIG
jgi:cytokinesis protein